MKIKNTFFIFFILNIGLLAYVIFDDIGYRHLLLFFTSILMGAVFYLSFFGFTGGWKNFILHKKTLGLRAQILLLSVSTLLIFPLINLESPFFNFSHGGSFAPIGFSLIIGSFMFGGAMQLAGGCASGTLFSAGGGNIKMLIVLVFFIIGSTIGTFYFDYWSVWPALTIVKFEKIYYLICVLLLGLFFCRFLFNLDKSQIRIFDLRDIKSSAYQHKLPLWVAIVLISLLCSIILLLSGHPWSITFGFSLWGSKFVSLLGLDVINWSFWNSNDFTKSFINNSILFETTSLMNIGLISGALLSSLYLGNFFEISQISKKEIFKTIIAGLIMGIGARLAFGCNIGAMLGGIVSGSLHGWVWLIFAFLGSYLVLKMRWHE